MYPGLSRCDFTFIAPLLCRFSHTSFSSIICFPVCLSPGIAHCSLLQPASARSPLRPSSASRRTSQPSTARSSSASPLRQSAPAELSSASPARSALSATGAVPLQQPAWRPTGVNIDRGSSRRGGSPSDARDLDVRSSSPFSPKRERDSYVQTHGVHLRRSVVWAAARDAESGLPV